MDQSTSEQTYILDRVEKRQVVDGISECWEWKLARHADGYGFCFRRNGVARRGVGAHRHSYEVFVGQIPDGAHIDHLCRNPPCVNPEHLEPVTPTENMRRGRDARLGRPYSVYFRGENLWAAAITVSTNPRRRKVFSSTDRDTAIAKAEEYLASLR